MFKHHRYPRIIILQAVYFKSMRLKFQKRSELKFVSRIPAGQSGGDPERSEGSLGFYLPAGGWFPATWGE